MEAKFGRSGGDRRAALGRTLRRLAAAALAVAVAACSNVGDGADVADPYEGFNRRVHGFNKNADTVILKPVSAIYGTVVPRPMRRGVDNVVNNLSLPGKLVNHVLQGDMRDAGETFARFGMNTVFGLGGVLDPAADAGLYERDTDFGETLARWGVRQGAYIELPVFGPSSERDLAGRIVDFAIDPVSNVLPADALELRRAGEVANLVNQRHELRGVVEALLYESADSYTALRIAYLQNKSRRLGGGLSEDDLEDPYADLELE